MFVTGTAIYELDPKHQPPGAYLLEPLPNARLDILLSKSVDDSTGVIPFVIDLMQMDPATRPTAQEALDHPWLTSHLIASTPSVVNIFSAQNSAPSSPAASPVAASQLSEPASPVSSIAFGWRDRMTRRSR